MRLELKKVLLRLMDDHGSGAECEAPGRICLEI